MPFTKVWRTSVFRAEYLREHLIELISAVVAVAVAGSAFEVHLTHMVVDERFEHLLAVAAGGVFYPRESVRSHFLCLLCCTFKPFVGIEKATHNLTTPCDLIYNLAILIM